MCGFSHSYIIYKYNNIHSHQGYELCIINDFRLSSYMIKLNYIILHKVKINLVGVAVSESVEQ